VCMTSLAEALRSAAAQTDAKADSCPASGDGSKQNGPQ